jgi:hypothetical protein
MTRLRYPALNHFWTSFVVGGSLVAAGGCVTTPDGGDPSVSSDAPPAVAASGKATSPVGPLRRFVAGRATTQVASAYVGTYSTNSPGQFVPMDLGVIVAGETLQIGTCGVGSASFGGDTYLRLEDADTGEPLGINDNNCGGSGSKIVYTAGYRRSLRLMAGCASGLCNGTVDMTTTFDSNGTISSARQAFDAIPTSSSLTGFWNTRTSGSAFDGYRSYYLPTDFMHLEGIQRIRTGPHGLAANTLVVSGSLAADLNFVSMGSKSPDFELGAADFGPGHDTSYDRGVAQSRWQGPDNFGNTGDHYGGIQVSGRYLFAAHSDWNGFADIVSNGVFGEDLSVISHRWIDVLDLGNYPAAPSQWLYSIDLNEIHGGASSGETTNAAASVAVTKLASGSFLLAVYGDHESVRDDSGAWNTVVDLFVLDPDATGFASIADGAGQWHRVSRSEGFRGWAGDPQGMALITNDDGSVALVGLDSNPASTCRMFYTDLCVQSGGCPASDAYGGHVNQWTFYQKTTAPRYSDMDCSANGQEDFNRAGGIFIDPGKDRFIVYGTTGWPQQNQDIDMDEWAAPPSARPSDACLTTAACDDCTGRAGCGWDTDSGMCLNGTTGPALSRHWVTSGAQCPADPCRATAECDLCTHNPGCGWNADEGTCVTGTPRGRPAARAATGTGPGPHAIPAAGAVGRAEGPASVTTRFP